MTFKTNSLFKIRHIRFKKRFETDFLDMLSEPGVLYVLVHDGRQRTDRSVPTYTLPVTNSTLQLYLTESEVFSKQYAV